MTLREYYKLTRETTNSCIKICGVIFTSINVVIAIISGLKNDSFTDSIEIFIICCLMGNGLGLFIWFLAIISAFGQVKGITKFYESIPTEIKDRFGLRLFVRRQNPKYHFMELDIYNTNLKQLYLFNYDAKNVWITIFNDLNTIDNFQNRTLEIQKKYKHQKIVLTGWGLRKIISKNDWKIITEEQVNEILEELKTISENEGFVIIQNRS